MTTAVFLIVGANSPAVICSVSRTLFIARHKLSPSTDATQAATADEQVASVQGLVAAAAEQGKQLQRHAECTLLFLFFDRSCSIVFQRVARAGASSSRQCQPLQPRQHVQRAPQRVLKHSRSSTLPPRVPAACHGHRVAAAAAAACCALGHVSCARARAHDDSESRPEAAVACMAAKAAAQTALAVTAATSVRRDGTRLIVK